MKTLTPAQMHTFAEYALEHIFILNCRAPKNVEFSMSYSTTSIRVSLFIYQQGTIKILYSEHAYTYTFNKDNSEVFNKIKSWEEKYLKKETPEDDTLG